MRLWDPCVPRGGTLYLDEVGQLDATCQARLLAILKSDAAAVEQTAAMQPLGVRVIASSSIDLHQEVQRGRFSLELLYQLNTITLSAVELKQRREDLPALVRHVIGARRWSMVCR